MTRRQLMAILLAGASMGAAACGKLGPQKKDAEPAPVNTKDLYQVDLSKPDGPMYQMLRAAQERDLDLFRQSFAPSMDVSHMSETGFRKFRKKVLTNKMTPVPESIQQVSDTEAIVKLRNGKGKEIPVHVQKFGDKWLITSFDLGPKLRQRLEEKEKQLQQGGGQTS
jgi:hypothetical protein